MGRRRKWFTENYRSPNAVRMRAYRKRKKEESKAYWNIKEKEYFEQRPQEKEYLRMEEPNKYKELFGDKHE